MLNSFVPSSTSNRIYKKTLWPQWLAGFTVSLAVITTGLANGWTSPFLAKLTLPDVFTPFKLTDAEASWVASLLNFGRFGGAILAAILQGMIGRKRTLLLSALPITIGWLCMIFASSVIWLYVARLFCGIGSGCIWSSISLYVGEIADPSIRGALILMNPNAASVGALLGNTLGPYLPLEEFGYVPLTFIAFFIALFSFIPESPYHYVLKGDIKQAEKSLRWFKCNANIGKEIEDIKSFVGNNNLSFKEKLLKFNKPNNRKNIFCLLILNVFLYFAGHNLMSYYSEIIITKSKVSFTPSTIVIALGLCTVIAGATATFFVDKFGRRALLIGSSIGTTVAMILLGLHFHFLSLKYNPCKLTWLPIISFFLFNFSISYGMVPVPGALLGELFDHHSKTLASMIFSSVSALLSFLTIRSFQPATSFIGEKYVFWIFALSAFSTAPFTYFYIPETKGKTLIDIQNKNKLPEMNDEAIKTITHQIFLKSVNNCM